MPEVSRGTLHHVEVWVPELERALEEWGWLLGELGYVVESTWEDGVTFRFGPTYLVLEASPAQSATRHDRLRPGVNHLAFHAGTPDEVDRLVRESRDHGWVSLFEDAYPHAGGAQHFAGYLVNSDGYEVELVAAT